MKKSLDKQNTLITAYGFPVVYSPKKRRYKVLIGVGANLGNPLKTFKLLLNILLKYPKINIIKTSPILKNPPFGYTNQPDFYNALIWATTDYPPLKLLHILQYIEKSLGRKRSFLNAPRTIDLDLIMFENLILYNKRLILPHPRWQERSSVLMPMYWMSFGRKWRA